ncbi:hypothetical protein ES703_84237 [subsurface metagenome]
MLAVAGYWADVISVAVATIQYGYLRQPAIYPAITAAGAENDRPIGHISWFDVVVWPVGELLEPGAVGIYLVEVVVL